MQIRYSIAFTANQLGFEFDNVDKWYKVIDETHGELVDCQNGDGDYIPAPTIEQVREYLKDKYNILVSDCSIGMFDVPGEGKVELFYPIVIGGIGNNFLTQFESDNKDDVLQNGIEWVLNVHENVINID